MPVHVYDVDSGHCVLTILRPGKTLDGKEVRAHLRRLDEIGHPKELGETSTCCWTGQGRAPLGALGPLLQFTA